jgi:hypothetical protein
VAYVLDICEIENRAEVVLKKTVQISLNIAEVVAL